MVLLIPLLSSLVWEFHHFCFPPSPSEAGPTYKHAFYFTLKVNYLSLVTRHPGLYKLTSGLCVSHLPKRWVRQFKYSIAVGGAGLFSI